MFALGFRIEGNVVCPPVRLLRPTWSALTLSRRRHSRAPQLEPRRLGRFFEAAKVGTRGRETHRVEPEPHVRIEFRHALTVTPPTYTRPGTSETKGRCIRSPGRGSRTRRVAGRCALFWQGSRRAIRVPSFEEDGFSTRAAKSIPAVIEMSVFTNPRTQSDVLPSDYSFR